MMQKVSKKFLLFLFLCSLSQCIYPSGNGKAEKEFSRLVLRGGSLGRRLHAGGAGGAIIIGGARLVWHGGEAARSQAEVRARKERFLGQARLLFAGGKSEEIRDKLLEGVQGVRGYIISLEELFGLIRELYDARVTRKDDFILLQALVEVVTNLDVKSKEKNGYGPEYWLRPHVYNLKYSLETGRKELLCRLDEAQWTALLNVLNWLTGPKDLEKFQALRKKGLEEQCRRAAKEMKKRALRRAEEARLRKEGAGGEVSVERGRPRRDACWRGNLREAEVEYRAIPRVVTVVDLTDMGAREKNELIRRAFSAEILALFAIVDSVRRGPYAGTFNYARTFDTLFRYLTNIFVAPHSQRRELAACVMEEIIGLTKAFALYGKTDPAVKKQRAEMSEVQRRIKSLLSACREGSFRSHVCTEGEWAHFIECIKSVVDGLDDIKCS